MQLAERRFQMSLKNARKAAGYRQEDIAKLFGITPSAVCRWETGRALPNAAKLVKLSQIYGVSIEQLLREDDEDS